MASCAAHLKRYDIQLTGTPTTINNTADRQWKEEKKNHCQCEQGLRKRIK